MRYITTIVALALLAAPAAFSAGKAGSSKPITHWSWETNWVTRTQLDRIAIEHGYKAGELFGLTMTVKSKKGTPAGVTFVVSGELDGTFLLMEKLHEECHQEQFQVRGVTRIDVALHGAAYEGECTNVELQALKKQYGEKFDRSQNVREFLRLANVPETDQLVLFLDRFFRLRDLGVTLTAVR